MSSFPEILLILAIVVIVFGVGKVSRIGSQLGKAKSEFKKGLAGDGTAERKVIDITPESEDPMASYGPKPGTRVQPVEDAEIETADGA